MGAQYGNNNGFRTSNTLCWSCRNAVPDRRHGCSWSECFEPVKGWEATKRPKGVSYTVKSCPEFIPDDETQSDELLRKAKRYEKRARTEYQYGNAKVADALMEKSKRNRLAAKILNKVPHKQDGQVPDWDGKIHFADDYDRNTFFGAWLGV